MNSFAAPSRLRRSELQLPLGVPISSRDSGALSTSLATSPATAPVTAPATSASLEVSSPAAAVDETPPSNSFAPLGVPSGFSLFVSRLINQ